jgi:hypothetical protein
LRTFFIQPFLVWNNFQEERDVTAGTLCANLFNPSPFAIHDCRHIGQSIVQQDLDAMGAGID